MNGIREKLVSIACLSIFVILVCSQKNGNQANWSNVKTSIQAQNPLVLFMMPYYLITLLSIGETSATIKTMQYTANHIMIVHGTMLVRYYDGSVIKRTDRYLRVSSGLNAAPNSYILVNSDTTINDIVSVAIF